MRKNFALGDRVVGKIKMNLNHSGSVVQVVDTGHEGRIHVKWSDGTTTEETVRAVDKEGSAGDIRRHTKTKICDCIMDDGEG